MVIRSTEFTVGDTKIDVEQSLTDIFEHGYTLGGERIMYEGYPLRRAKITHRIVEYPLGNEARTIETVEQGVGYGITMEAAVLRALYSHRVSASRVDANVPIQESVYEPVPYRLEPGGTASLFDFALEHSTEFWIAGNPDRLAAVLHSQLPGANDRIVNQLIVRENITNPLDAFEELADGFEERAKAQNYPDRLQVRKMKLPKTLFGHSPNSGHHGLHSIAN